MSKKSEAYNRVRTYLRNNHINYSTNDLWLKIGDISIQDMPVSKTFIIRIRCFMQVFMEVPYCEPDTLLKKAYNFNRIMQQAKVNQERRSSL